MVAFRCVDPVATFASPPPPYAHSIVLDAVAVDTGTGAEPLTTDGAPYPLFAKTGLLVRADRPVTLTVPVGTAISWGNGGQQWARVLRIGGCPATLDAAGPWMAYPGGFSVDRPGCVPLEVSTPTRRTTIRVPLGRRC